MTHRKYYDNIIPDIHEVLRENGPSTANDITYYLNKKKYNGKLTSQKISRFLLAERSRGNLEYAGMSAKLRHWAEVNP